ncbi:hypothetical protein ACFQ07_14740, partial [Actinomadura adrarensis]
LDADRRDMVDVTPATRQPAWVVWRWADGQLPLPAETLAPDATDVVTPWEDRIEFTANARPQLYRHLEGNPARMAALNLAFMIERLVLSAPDAESRAAGLERVRSELERLNFEIGRLDPDAPVESLIPPEDGDNGES